MLAIKVRLDTNNERGQFLLTGSANVTTVTTIADALPGRVEYIRLWPFSQGELHGDDPGTERRGRGARARHERRGAPT